METKPITLILTEAQTQTVLAGLGELKLGIALETFGTIQAQIMKQRQSPASTDGEDKS